MEVGPREGSLQIANYGSTTLAIADVVDGVTESFGFACGVFVDV